MMCVCLGRKDASARFSRIQPLICLIVPISAATACSAGKTNTPAAAPPQPNFPSTPPVPITWSLSSGPPPAPPAEVPPPAGSNHLPVTLSSPTDGATLTSPVTVAASASSKNAIFLMRTYVDQPAVYFTFTNFINTQISLTPGQHELAVLAQDNRGFISATILNLTVTTQSQTAISNLQSLPAWRSCSFLFPPGCGRDGQICAAGRGTAHSVMTQKLSAPSMGGQSAQFSMGGPTGYSDMPYYNAVAGGNNVSHFIYDLHFYLDNPTASRALEFDINQTFGGNRWVWGSECNFNGSGKWDIWDDVNGWQPTIYDCRPFPFNTRIHLVWNVERVGNQVYCISLSVDDQTYNIDTYYCNQSNGTLETINVAFQLDGNYKQERYNMWLDKVQLTASLRETNLPPV